MIRKTELQSMSIPLKYQITIWFSVTKKLFANNTRTQNDVVINKSSKNSGYISYPII